MPMTPERLDEIEFRTLAVPRAPWHTEYFGDEGYPQRVTNSRAIVIADTHEGGTGLRPIPEFIAHARQDIPALIAEVRRLRVALKAAAPPAEPAPEPGCVHDCDEVTCSAEECAMCPCCGDPAADPEGGA